MKTFTKLLLITLTMCCGILSANTSDLISDDIRPNGFEFQDCQNDWDCNDCSDVKPFQIALFNPWQLQNENTSISGLSINLIYGANCNVKGADVGIVNRVYNDITGAQLGFVNYVDGYVYGVQYGFFNLAESVLGVQDGFVNLACDLYGWQTGFINIANKQMVGVQTGLFNHTRIGEGIQLGFVNHGKQFEGLQVGIINYTEVLRGLQIGILNVDCSCGPYLAILPIVRASW